MIQELKKIAADGTQKKVLGDASSPSFSNSEYTTIRQRLLNQPEKHSNNKWYKGENPTRGESLARIFTISQNQPEEGRRLFESYIRFSSDASSPLYNPYTQATSPATTELANLGFDMSDGITPEWLADNAGLKNHYRTGTSGSPLAPSSSSTPENDAAYWYYKALDAEETTQLAETEWGALQEELYYWVNRSDRNYRDEEILAKIDWSAYPTLVKMDEGAASGVPLALNRAVGYSRDVLPGVLWAARNNGGTGNPLYDSVSAALGRGTTWRENPEITAKLDPTNPAYNPYAVGSTVDDAALYFGVRSFDSDWLETNRGYINGHDETAQKYYRDVYQAEQTTARAEAELAELNADVEHLLKYSSTPDAIFASLEYDFSSKYPTLAKMDASLESGKLLSMTRAVDYRWDDVVARVNEHCERYNAAEPATDYAERVSEVLQSTPQSPKASETVAAIALSGDAAIEASALTIGQHGTTEEKTVFETAYSAAYESSLNAIRAGLAQGGLGTVDGTARLMESADAFAADNYLGILEAVIPYETAQADLAEAEAEIADLEARHPWLLNPMLTEAMQNAHIPQGLIGKVTAQYAAALDRANSAREVIETGAADYEAAQGTIKTLREGYDAAFRFSALSGTTPIGSELLGAMDFVYQYGSAYTPTEWSPTTVYDYYDSTLGEGSGVQAAQSALVSIPMEIARIDATIDLLEQHGVDLSGGYSENIDRRKGVLNRQLLDAQYYMLQYEEGFAEAAERGRAAWYSSPAAQKADAWYYHLTTPDQLGVQTADPDAMYFNVMTDVEKQTLFYLYEEQGKEAASEYFNHLTNPSYGRLTVRESIGTMEEMAGFAEEAPVIMTGMSVLLSPLQAEGTIYSAVAAATGNEINPYHRSFGASNIIGKTRETVKSEITSAFGNSTGAATVANFFYDAVTAAGDSTVNAAIFAPLGSAAGAGYMGFAAAGAAMQDIKMRGGSDSQALLMGGITWATESMTELVTIGNMRAAFGKGTSATRSFLKDFFADAGEEALGEALSEFITSASDTAIMGALSNYEESVDAYIAAGMRPEDAERRATLDVVNNILYAGALGAASSTVTTGSSYASGYASYILTGEKSTSADVKSGESEMPANPAESTVADTHSGEITSEDGKSQLPPLTDPVTIDESVAVEAEPVSHEHTEIQPTVDDALQGQPVSASVESSPLPETVTIDESVAVEAEPVSHEHTEIQPTVDTALLGRQMSALATAQTTTDEASQTATVAAVLAPANENPQATAVASAAAQHMSSEYGGAQSAAAVSSILVTAAENGVSNEAVTVAVSTAALTDGESHTVLTKIVTEGATAENVKRLLETAKKERDDPNARAALADRVLSNRVAQRVKMLVADGGLSGLASYQSAVTQAQANLNNAKQQLQQAQEAQAAAGSNLQSTAAQMLSNPGDAAMRGAVQQAVKDVEGAAIVTRQMEQSVEKCQAQLQEAEATLENVTQSTLKKLREQAVQEIAAEDEQAAREAAAQAQAEADAAARERATLEAEAAARYISLTNKTTGAATSDETLRALTTLAVGGTLTLDDIQTLPEVRDAYAMVGDVRAQVEQYSPVWESEVPAVIAELSELGSAVKGANGKVQYTGPVAQNRRLDIVIGLPAAGKSSVLADPLSEKHQSRIIDSDMAKERLSGYRDGLGAGVVHEVSGVVKEAVLEKALERGDNIVLPIIGSDVDKLRTLINDYKAAGYSVHLHLNELAAGKAIGRALNRYLAQGRFIDPRFLFNYGNKPSAVYDQLIAEEGLLDGHSKYSNDVDLGQEPIFLGGSENLPSDRGTDEPGGGLEPERSSEVPGPEGTGAEEQRADESAGRVSASSETSSGEAAPRGRRNRRPITITGLTSIFKKIAKSGSRDAVHGDVFGHVVTVLDSQGRTQFFAMDGPRAIMSATQPRTEIRTGENATHQMVYDKFFKPAEETANDTNVITEMPTIEEVEQYITAARATSGRGAKIPWDFGIPGKPMAVDAPLLLDMLKIMQGQPYAKAYVVSNERGVPYLYVHDGTDVEQRTSAVLLPVYRTTAQGTGEYAQSHQEAQAERQRVLDSYRAQQGAETIQAKKGVSSTSAPAGISTDATGKPKFSPHRIAKDLTKALDIGGDIGTRKMNNMPQAVLGYYEQRAKYIAVRSRQAGNYVTTMHEIGHTIADRLRMTGTSDMVAKLDPAFASSYTPAELPGEAFAEFMWRYMESDTRGRSFAGDTFVDTFEQRLRGAGLYRDVKDAQKNLQIWINANTNDQIGATVVNQSDANKKSWGQRFRSLLSEMVDSTAALNNVDNAIRAANNGSIPVGESIRQQALLKNTAAQRAFNILHKGLTDSHWTVIGKSLADRFSEAGLIAKDADLLNRYALALHSLDRDAQGKPVFDDHITPEARAAFIKDVETNHPEVVAAEKAWQEFRTEFLQAMMVDTGYMTQGTLDLFNKMYPHYVPTMRVKEGQTYGGRSGTYAVRRATGSTEDIINPMDSFVRMIDSVVTMVSANNAALAWDAAYNKYKGMGVFGRLITADTVTHTVDTTELNEAVRDLLEGNTDEDIMDQVLDLIGHRQSQVKNTGTSTDPGTLQVQLPNGTRRLYKIFDPGMFAALASAQNGTYQFGMWAPLAWATRAMSALTTGSNPIFGARNFLRDFQSSVNYGSWASNYATGMAKWMRAAYDVWAQKGEYKDYTALGGGGWTQIYAGRQKSADEYRAALYKGYNTANVGRTVKYAGKKLWETVTLAKLNEVIEQTSRYAEYKYGKHDKSTAEGRQAAFLAGQDATVDFHRRGSSQGVVTLKAVIPFFNASLQGVYRTGRMYTEQGERGRLPQRFAKTVLNTAVASALGAGLLLRFLNDDEREEFEWLSNDLKSQHIYIPNFAPSIFGEQPLIRIPLAQDPLTYAVHNAVTNAVWGGDESVIDLMSTVDTILDNINPLGDPITQAWTDTQANRTWYGSKIVPTRMESWDATLQYTEETPELFITLGRITGQSPMKLQYLAEQYTGFVGQMAIPALSYDATGELGGVEAAVNSARKKLTSDPLVSNDIISAFYDGSNLMDAVLAAVKNDRPLNMLRPGLAFEEGQQAYEEAYAMTHKGGIIYEVSSYISDTYAAIDAINARTDLSDAEKYELTSARRREMIEVTLGANEAIQAYREKYITGKGLTSRLFEGTYTEPMSAFQKLPAVFANAAEEPYMKNARATWEATGDDNALPHPNTSFSAGKVEYVIGESDWDQWCSWYNEAYRLHLSKYEIGWDALSPEEQLDILKEAHTKAHNYCKSQYLAK